MKKFKFRLDTLLRVRQLQKEQAQLNFAAAVSRVMAAKTLLEQLQLQLAENMASFHTVQNKPISIEFIRSYHYYFNKMQENIEGQQQSVQQAEQQQQQCLNALNTAVNKFKIIEKLRFKRLDQFKAEVLCEEQHYLDDVGMQIYARQAR